jgi:hypothetical protein
MQNARECDSHSGFLHSEFCILHFTKLVLRSRKVHGAKHRGEHQHAKQLEGQHESGQNAFANRAREIRREWLSRPGQRLS